MYKRNKQAFVLVEALLALSIFLLVVSFYHHSQIRFVQQSEAYFVDIMMARILYEEIAHARKSQHIRQNYQIERGDVFYEVTFSNKEAKISDGTKEFTVG